MSNFKGIHSRKTVVPKFRLDNMVVATLRYAVLTGLGSWLLGKGLAPWIEGHGVDAKQGWEMISGSAMSLIGIWWAMVDANKKASDTSTKKLQLQSALRKTVTVISGLLVGLNIFPEHVVAEIVTAVSAVISMIAISVNSPEKIYKARVIGKELPTMEELLDDLKKAMPLLVISFPLLWGCEAIKMSATEWKAYAEEASGFDPSASVHMEVGEWHGVALRIFNLPIGPGIVWIGPMKPVAEPVAEPTK